MSRRFGRVWRVAVDTIETTELDIEFNVKKTLKTEPNTCELTIYNLNPEHRAQLAELASSKTKSKNKAATKGVPCRIEAGYEDTGPELIWLGDLRTCESVYQGEDWVTTLTSGDGEKAWQNAKLHVAFGAKTDVATALRAMARALGVDEGNLGKVVSRLKMAGSAAFPSGKYIAGSVQGAILNFARSADLDLSIQNGALQILDRGKALDEEAVYLSRETGLLESPTVDNDGIVTVVMQLTSGVRPGRLMKIEAEHVKGTYKAAETEHNGASRGGPWQITAKGPRY